MMKGKVKVKSKVESLFCNGLIVTLFHRSVIVPFV